MRQSNAAARHVVNAWLAAQKLPPIPPDLDYLRAGTFVKRTLLGEDASPFDCRVIAAAFLRDFAKTIIAAAGRST